MPYSFRGELFGFGGPPTEEEKARVRNHLEAFAADSVALFGSYRLGPRRDRMLPPLGESSIIYDDPGLVDPPLADCVVTFQDGKGACGRLSIYTVGWYRFHGEPGAGFDITTRSTRVLRDGAWRLVNLWHIRTRRWNGQIEDWSRMRGMKG